MRVALAAAILAVATGLAMLATPAAADPGDPAPTRPALSVTLPKLKLNLSVGPLTLDLPALSRPLPRPAPVNLDVSPALSRLGFGRQAWNGSNFVGVDLPLKPNAAGVAAGLGLFAAKLWATQQLCGLGRCRVDTGPGDLPAGWVEQLTPR